jgi:hypothetical protein
LAFDAQRDILYVASTGDNAIYAIKHAATTGDDNGQGKVVVQDPQHLHGPLGLTLAPNGDLIASNGDAVNQDPNQLNELVEYKRNGKFVGQFQLDGGAAGGAFGLAVQTVGDLTRFAAVDDNTNTLKIFTFDSTKQANGNGQISDGGQTSSGGQMGDIPVGGTLSSQPLSAIGGQSQGGNAVTGVDPSLLNSGSSGDLSSIDAIFGAFNSILKSLELRIEAMDPQTIAFFQTFNSALDSLESGLAGHPISI